MIKGFNEPPEGDNVQGEARGKRGEPPTLQLPHMFHGGLSAEQPPPTSPPRVTLLEHKTLPTPGKFQGILCSTSETTSIKGQMLGQEVPQVLLSLRK